MKKRFFSLLLVLALICALVPVGVFAAEPCSHTHDETCGYQAAVSETPCDKGCSETDEHGVILHAADCASQPGSAGSECSHAHDETCGGLVPLDAEVCTCTEKCAEGAVNSACPVCGAEGADLSACAGTVSELPAVTITYTDGTTESWDGSKPGIEIIKDCTITINRDYSHADQLLFASNVTATVNGNGHIATIQSPSGNPFWIAAGAKVTMNNLTIVNNAGEGHKNPVFIIIGAVEMNGVNVVGTENNQLKLSANDAKLTANNCVLDGSLNSSLTTIAGYGTVTLNYCVVKNAGQAYNGKGSSSTLFINDSQILQTNANAVPIVRTEGTIYMNSGLVSQHSGSASSCISGTADSAIHINGGTVQGEGSPRGVFSSGEIYLTGGLITGFVSGTGVGTNTKLLEIGGNMTFSNNSTDVYLASEKVFTIRDDFTGTASVRTSDAIPDNTKRVITTADTDPEKLSQFTAADEGYQAGYDAEGTCLFLYKHVHDWRYTADGSTVTADCTITTVPPCGLCPTLTLNAEDMAYTGAAYDKASVLNEITAVTGAEAGSITYWSGSTQLEEAPTEIGSYIAKITIGGETAEDAFEIYAANTVTFVVDGETIETQIVKQGTNAALPPIPHKVGYDQTAPYWDLDGTCIMEDTTITAVYTINKYTVTYIADGKVVGTEVVEHGQDASMMKAPEKTGYTVKWDSDGKAITGDTTITAVYTAIVVTPETGDHSPIALWTAAMTVSLAAAVLLLARRKKYMN